MPIVKPTPRSTLANRATYQVDLPSGGNVQLRSAAEVTYWEDLSREYISDYGLVKSNDLLLLGAILTQAVIMFRAQQDVADPTKSKAAAATVTKAAEEIRTLEKALGIDKSTREKGGQHTVADYITRVKRAAHAKGVHISERVAAYEKLAMEARWKLRLLRNGDDEDRAYHGISERAIVAWLEDELLKLETKDKEWAKDKGKIFVGKL